MANYHFYCGFFFVENLHQVTHNSSVQINATVVYYTKKTTCFCVKFSIIVYFFCSTLENAVVKKEKKLGLSYPMPHFTPSEVPIYYSIRAELFIVDYLINPRCIISYISH